MNLNDLRIFCSVATTGSFTAAASTLSIPVATVSRRVNTLEADLGAALLNRNTRSLQLTESGSALLGRAAPLMEEFEDIKQETVADQQTARGKLSLQIPLELFAGNFVPSLQGFLKLYPNISLQVQEYLGRNHRLPEDFDLTLISYELGLPSSDWIAVPLMSLTQGIFAHSKFSKKSSLTPQSLYEYPLISRYEEKLWHFRQGKQIESVAIEGKIQLDSLSQQILAAENGMGLIKAPFNSVKQSLKNKTLVAVATTLPPIALSVALYYRSRVQPMRVKVFMDFLQRNLAN